MPIIIRSKEDEPAKASYFVLGCNRRDSVFLSDYLPRNNFGVDGVSVIIGT